MLSASMHSRFGVARHEVLRVKSASREDVAWAGSDMQRPRSMFLPAMAM